MQISARWIVFDGVPYTVTFNIRDKEKNQYQYLIDFKENKTSGLSNTAVKNLLRADQMSYDTSIAQNSEKSTPSAQENFDKVRRSRTASGDVVTISKGELTERKSGVLRRFLFLP